MDSSTGLAVAGIVSQVTTAAADIARTAASSGSAAAPAGAAAPASAPAPAAPAPSGGGELTRLLNDPTAVARLQDMIRGANRPPNTVPTV